MIAWNPNVVVEDHEFAKVFQRMLPEVEQRVGRDLTVEIAVERTRLIIYGYNDQCEWDGEWPRMECGRIARTPEYWESEAKIQELYG